MSVESHVANPQQPVSALLKLERLKEPSGHMYAVTIRSVELAKSLIGTRWLDNPIGIRSACDRCVPVFESVAVREATQKVDVLFLHQEIDIINGDYLVGSGSKADGLYFDVAVEKLRRETGSFGSDFQRRALSQRTKARKGDYYKRNADLLHDVS